MSRMYRNKSHTVINSLTNLFHNFIGYLMMLYVSPPEKHICVVKNFIGKAVRGHFLKSNRCFESAVCIKTFLDGTMHTVGIYSKDSFFFIMFIFIENCNSDLVHF